MLRVLIGMLPTLRPWGIGLAFLWLQSIALSAQSALPAAEDIKTQRHVIDETLKEAASLSSAPSFLRDITRSQKVLQSVQGQAGSDYFRLPEHSAQADVQALWQQGMGQQTPEPRRGISAPVIFVSFSLPESKLRELLEEADRIGALVVLRGLVNDDFNATMARLNDLKLATGIETLRSVQQNDQSNVSGIALDPTLFSRFQVETVPTFLLPVEPISPCDVDDCQAPPHVMASGAASLFYFLDLVKRTGNSRERKSAQQWLANDGVSP
jgi:type-F conjugative transfer system pilin assembly protein TrbC